MPNSQSAADEFDRAKAPQLKKPNEPNSHPPPPQTAPFGRFTKRTQCAR
jgi:hypothetical protein